jgi:hypothetical protein
MCFGVADKALMAQSIPARLALLREASIVAVE